MGWIMSNFKVGDRVKAKHRHNKDLAEFTLVNVTAEALECETFYFWVDDWIFEVIERPWKLPTENGIYVDEVDIGNLGGDIRTWRMNSGYWAELGTFKTFEQVEADLKYRKINLRALRAA